MLQSSLRYSDIHGAGVRDFEIYIQQYNLLSWQLRILGGISKYSQNFFHAQAQIPYKVRIISSCREGKIKPCLNKLVL